MEAVLHRYERWKQEGNTDRVCTTEFPAGTQSPTQLSRLQASLHLDPEHRSFYCMIKTLREYISARPEHLLEL